MVNEIDSAAKCPDLKPVIETIGNVADRGGIVSTGERWECPVDDCPVFLMLRRRGVGGRTLGTRLFYPAGCRRLPGNQIS